MNKTHLFVLAFFAFTREASSFTTNDLFPIAYNQVKA